MKQFSIVQWAMRHHAIVILLAACLVAFGMFALSDMRKNEFPDFTVRQGLVVAVAPGNTSEEMADRVARPLEDYIFTYKEVMKEKTFSVCRDGMVYIQVELNADVTDKDAFWSKFKHGVEVFRHQLPRNVAAVVVNDDFGDTSALLIALEAKDKTYRQMNDYMDRLKEGLRRIPSVGRLTVSGMQTEQLSVYLDADRLRHYGLNEQTLALTLFNKGFNASGAQLRGKESAQPVYVAHSLNTGYDVEQLIVYSAPTGEVVRLKDVARIVREYPRPDSYVDVSPRSADAADTPDTAPPSRRALILSVEMKKGQNIVQMGEEVNRTLEAFGKTLPADVQVVRITDQPAVVKDSVYVFLRELLIAVGAVILVVVLLLPLKVALVSAATIPVTIFISLGLFYALGIELNTVTLAGLIVCLGLVVDDAVVIVDNYIEQLADGLSRWHASIRAAQHFFKSVLTATVCISCSFFPFLFTMKGVLHDFLLSFPWAIAIVLFVSLAVALMLVPFMQYWFIREPVRRAPAGSKRARFSFLSLLQTAYNRVLDVCFAHPRATLTAGVAAVVVGGVLMARLPQQLMPVADRNQFAVEISLPPSSTLDRTRLVADSLERMLLREPLVTGVTGFIGAPSPRFHSTYAPRLPGTDYAQLIVDTRSAEATETLLDSLVSRYEDRFPDAEVRFKQLSYSDAVAPIEIRLSGDDPVALRAAAERAANVLRRTQGTLLVRSDYRRPRPAAEVRLREDEAARLGVTNTMVETALALRYGTGVTVADVWEGADRVPVVLKGVHADSARATELADEPLPAAGGLRSVPLRQVAEVRPTWQDGQVVRRNGVPTVTISADLKRGYNAGEVTKAAQAAWEKLPAADGIRTEWGGEYAKGQEDLPPLLQGLALAAVLIFFVLLMHYQKVSLATLTFLSMSFCVFGAALGILLFRIPFGVTCVLGIVSLMGIIVRNGIIMFDYAEELRRTERMHVREAIYQSARRRMRPIFLTSAAASMGVIPMILGRSSLWMPMGVVICVGTLLTMVVLLTVLPVAYLLLMHGSTRRRERAQRLESL